MVGTTEFSMLPFDCVSTIISLTSPTDACKSVSPFFRLAAESDLIWETFLPSDYLEIAARSVIPIKFSSKKELYFKLSQTTIIDSGKKSFSLKKSSGRKSYIISARELSILGSNDTSQWRWELNPTSRFSEVAELKTTSELKIQGNINTKMLSPNTKYGAYLIMQVTNGSYGLDEIPSEISIKVGDNQEVTNTAYLGHTDNKKQQILNLFYTHRGQMLKKRVIDGDQHTPHERTDGWMEVKLGEFFSGEKDDDKEVKMSVMEVKGHQLKGGLIIQGIEVRPTHEYLN